MDERRNKWPRMRRILPGLLMLCAWALALGMQPPAAFAEPDTPYDPATVIRVLPLSDSAVETLDLLYRAALAHQEEVKLPEGTPFDDACAAAASLTQDYPELFHLAPSWSVFYYQQAPDMAASVTLRYHMTAQEYAQAWDAVSQSLQTAMNGQPAGEADRAETLHDWLCARLDYGGIADGPENTAYGALTGGVTRCAGYAQGLSLLLRTAGIPCGVVTGTATASDGSSESHAWNVAVIDGVSTLIDATWDDQSNGLIFHWYCGVTDALMAADHTPDPEQRVPVCDSMAVNWHVRRGLLVNDETDLNAGFRALVLGDNPVDLRFADANFFAQAVNRLSNQLQAYNESAPADEQFFGSYIAYPNNVQHCLVLQRGP